MIRASIALLTLLTLALTSTVSAQTVVQGTTRFAKIVELHALQPGRVAEVSIKEADAVRAGDILIALENGLQSARVQVAEVAASNTATIQRGEVLLEQAGSRLKRIERAASRGGAPKWEVAEARLAVRAAQAELSGAREQAAANQARLNLEREGMEQFLVRAPFDGEVLELNASAGTLADGRTPLLVLADRAEIEVLTFLPADQAFALQTGSVFDAALGNPISQDLKAVLVSVDPRVEPASGTVRAVFRLNDASLQIPAGIEVRISLASSG